MALFQRVELIGQSMRHIKLEAFRNRQIKAR